MSERLSSKYQTLFQVHILHHYWLDDGLTVFDQISDVAKKNQRLLTYDVRDFLTINPTPTTAKTLNALSCVYKTTALGLLVSVKENTIIPKDTVFEWLISVKNSHFFHYTALTLRGQKIHNLPFADTVYRYKENVVVLSNLTGATRGTGSNKTLFLSQEIPTLSGEDQIEALILSGNKLKQLTSDSPSPNTFTLNNQAKDLPIFVHQGDVPVITPPAGLESAPKRGILLDDTVTDDVFAVMRLHAERASNDQFSFVTHAGMAKNTPPIFQVRFKNRSTIWQYFNKSNGVFKSEEAHPLPLTYFGNAAGTKLKPSAGLPKAIKDGVRITRLVSEIFE